MRSSRRWPSLPPLPLGGGDPTLEQLAAAWVFTHTSENTRRAYWADLGAFAAFCTSRGGSALDASADDVEEYRREVETVGASAATVARRLASLASFYRYAGAADATAPNPVASVPRPARPATSSTDVLEPDEVAALLRAAERLGPKTTSLVCLLLLDGLKVGEAVGADVDDLQRRGRSTTLALGRDDGHRHEVTLDSRTARALDRYLDGRRDGPLLLSDPSGDRPPRRLTRFGANYLVKRAAQGARLVKSVSANSLRRSFAAAALEAGVHVRAVQSRLGHADIRTTRRLSSPR